MAPVVNEFEDGGEELLFAEVGAALAVELPVLLERKGCLVWVIAYRILG